LYAIPSLATDSGCRGLESMWATLSSSVFEEAVQIGTNAQLSWLMRS